MISAARQVVLFAKPRPVFSLDFTTGSLDSRVTASGGANGTYFDINGAIAAGTAPRFDYSLLTCGLRVENARTNLLLNSLIDGTSLSTQTVTVVSGSTYTLSFYGTGSIVNTDANTQTLAGSGAFPTRSTLTFVAGTTSLTCTVSGTVQYAQLELGSRATSFIPTAGASVTRSADSITMSGANLTDWYTKPQGTFFVDFTPDYADDATASQWAALHQRTGATNYLEMYCRTDGTRTGQPIFESRNTTLVSISGGNSDMASGIAQRLAMSWTAATISAACNGQGYASIANGSATGADAGTLNIGHATGPATAINGVIRKLKFYSTALTTAQLQALTRNG